MKIKSCYGIIVLVIPTLWKNYLPIYLLMKVLVLYSAKFANLQSILDMYIQVFNIHPPSFLFSSYWYLGNSHVKI